MASKALTVSKPNSTCEIIYNGACPVCSSGVSAVRSSGNSRYTDIVREPDALCRHALTPEDVQYRLHARMPDGRLVRGIDAVAVLLSAHPRWRWAGRLAQLPVLRQLGWAGYEAAAFMLFRWNKRKGNF